MKKNFTCLLLTILSINLVAQSMGDIIVNTNNSATLVFDSNIRFVVFGNNPPTSENSFEFYDSFTDGAVCVIRGNTPTAPKTSITVKLENQEVWYGFVSYGKKPEILYQYASKSKDVDVVGTNGVHNNPHNTNSYTAPKPSDSTPEFIYPFEIIGNHEINSKLIKAMGIKREVFSIGERIGDVTLAIQSFRNDNKNMFITLSIDNKSGNAYIIDGILFKFVEGKRRGLKRTEASTEERVMPISILGNKKVLAYTTEIIGIAIPLFSINNKGHLEVTIREKDGTRNAIFKIKGATLNKIKIL